VLVPQGFEHSSILLTLCPPSKGTTDDVGLILLIAGSRYRGGLSAHLALKGN